MMYISRKAVLSNIQSSGVGGLVNLTSADAGHDMSRGLYVTERQYAKRHVLAFLYTRSTSRTVDSIGQEDGVASTGERGGLKFYRYAISLYGDSHQTLAADSSQNSSPSGSLS